MEVTRVTTGAPWEKQVGYCRAVRVGPHIHVSGTVALEPDGSPYAPGKPYEQAKKILQTIAGVLAELGAGMEHVVRTRVYVTQIAQWAEVGRAHGEVFGAHPPASSMLEVSALVDPDFLVEIEAEAMVPS